MEFVMPQCESNNARESSYSHWEILLFHAIYIEYDKPTFLANNIHSMKPQRKDSTILFNFNQQMEKYSLSFLSFHIRNCLFLSGILFKSYVAFSQYSTHLLYTSCSFISSLSTWKHDLNSHFFLVYASPVTFTIFAIKKKK